jgi:hypothetical protein
MEVQRFGKNGYSDVRGEKVGSQFSMVGQGRASDRNPAELYLRSVQKVQPSLHTRFQTGRLVKNKFDKWWNFIGADMAKSDSKSETALAMWRPDTYSPETRFRVLPPAQNTNRYMRIDEIGIDIEGAHIDKWRAYFMEEKQPRTLDQAMEEFETLMQNHERIMGHFR